MKSSEIDNASKTSEQLKGERDDNDNFNNDINDDENDDDSSFLSRKRKKTSSRLPAMQKRIISDEDDDDSDDDDIELSRISEMVKRKRMAEAEKSEGKRISVSVSEGDKVDNEHESPVKESTKSQAKDTPGSSKKGSKKDADSKEALADKISKDQKRKRKLSEKKSEAGSTIKKKAKSEDSKEMQKPTKKHKKRNDSEIETINKSNRKESTSCEEKSPTKKREELKKLKTNREVTDKNVASAELDDDKHFDTNDRKDKQVLSAHDKNPYISDISDDELEDEEEENKESKITSDIFRANIFTNAFDRFSIESSLQDANQRTAIQKEAKEAEGKTHGDDESLAYGGNDAVDVKRNKPQKVLVKGDTAKPPKKDSEKTILEEESRSKTINDAKGKTPKRDKKEKEMDVGAKRHKKKSESSNEEYMAFEFGIEKIAKDKVKHKKPVDGTVLETPQKDSSKKRKEKKTPRSTELMKELEKGREKHHESANVREGKSTLAAMVREEDDVRKQLDSEAEVSSSKKEKKKKLKQNNADVDEKIEGSYEKGEVSSIDSKSSKKHRNSEGSMTGDVGEFFRNDQQESIRDKSKVDLSPSVPKPKSTKEKNSVEFFNQTLQDSGEKKNEISHRTLPTESDTDALTASKNAGESVGSKDVKVRKMADKEKVRESKKEKVTTSEFKAQSDNQKESARREKLELDSIKKDKKDLTGKIMKAGKTKDKAKETSKDTKGQSTDGTKGFVQMGKSPEKGDKSDKKVQSKINKDNKLDSKKDNMNTNKELDKKVLKEHKKVIHKEGKDSKVDSSREKDLRSDWTPKASPLKEAKDAKIIGKKEQKTPVKSKEVDLKIWGFGLPSPIKMQKLSKTKDLKKTQSKDAKLKKVVKSTESKESAEKIKKIDLQENSDLGSSELKLANIELPALEEKQSSDEHVIVTKTHPDIETVNFDKTETVENEDMEELPKDQIPMKETTSVEVAETVQEEPLESKGESVLQLETIGKATLEASDATSMDSPMTLQKTFETTSVNIDTTCNVTSIKDNVLEVSQCSLKEVIESVNEDGKDVQKGKDVDEKSSGIIDKDDKDRHESDEILNQKTEDRTNMEDEAKTEDHGSPLLLDKLSELGGGSDLEDHLGPFHGTKLEETDIDMKELSHPEDTLKMLTQQISRHDAPAEENKLPTPTVKMTGHDFSMLSEEINEKIQHLSSRSFKSELSEEEKHIVNISMEIAEDFVQKGDDHVNGLVESDDTAVNAQAAATETDHQDVSSTAISEPLELKELGQVIHSDSQDNTATAVNITSVSTTENVTADMIDCTIATEKEEVPKTVDPGVVITSSSVSRQETEVTRPSFSRSRTVDLEPRGIAQVVADFDLNSISSCILTSEKSVDNAPPSVDTSGNEVTMTDASNELNPFSDSQETGFSEENSRDLFKRKTTCLSSPTTWRKALFNDYVFSKPSLSEDFRKFSVVKGDYHQEEAECHNEVRDANAVC